MEVLFLNNSRAISNEPSTDSQRPLRKEDLLEKVKGLIEKWQQGVKVFEDCRVSAKS